MGLKRKFNWTKEPLYLIDGTSFLYRAFYAFPDLARSDGFPTNALYIVLRIILKILRQENPSYCCFFLDGPGPTFREDILETYKAQRLHMPEQLSQQIPPLLEAIELLGLPFKITEHGEADDSIASLSHRFRNKMPIVILGSDKDLYQCLASNVVIWDPGQRSEKIVTMQDFQSKEGLQPDQWPDYLALVGDKTDNIPGVPGIGPKSAKKLLQRFDHLEEIQEHFQELDLKERKKLESHLEDIFLYRNLTTLRTDYHPRSKPEDFICSKVQEKELASFFQQYEFKTLLKEMFSRDEEEVTPVVQASTQPKPVPEANRLKELPDLAKEEVGLVSANEQGFYLGWQNQEVLGQLSLEDLLFALQKVQAVYVPSYKELLHINPLWLQVPLSKCFDLSLASYLLNPEERDYSWPRLQRTYLGVLDVHRDNEGLTALAIGKLLKQRLHSAGLLDLMYALEMPLIPVLFNMEIRGVCIDLNAFKSFLQEVEEHLQHLTQKIYKLAGQEFNLRSTHQLGEVLFDSLRLKAKGKTPGGLPSTASQVLESMQDQHPIIGEILKYRSLEKLRSTYLQPLPKLVDNDCRLHTTFNQLATATGRLSSSRPNLQNIPIRGEYGSRIRSCFVAPEGKALIAADYSQIELRILAHMSQDPHLMDAFSRNEDIHTRTACLLFDKDPSSIKPDERRKAKTINFGLLYGMGPQKLGQETGLGLAKAKEFIDKYFSRLEKVRDFFASVESQAQLLGFVTTIAGRRRLLKDINSANQNLVQQAKRLAINTIVQGSAADIIKSAMIKVDEDSTLKSCQAQLILQIHDELLLEVPEKYAVKAGERTAEIMSEVFPLSVPLEAEWGTGKSWAEAH